MARKTKQQKADQKLAEADQLAEQWFAAAPCPEHGGADLTLGISNGYEFCQASNTIEWVVPRQEIRATAIAVVCRTCGRLTASFVNEPNKVWSFQRLRAAFVSMNE
ncbi:MAG: hypothetical protein FWF02_03695 [Micrococcales bacterium]|nr:hypothetical protein [Micrococcales bacterium]MCL2666793.1 hypothetical protein [Micrococcales bacterium]